MSAKLVFKVTPLILSSIFGLSACFADEALLVCYENGPDNTAVPLFQSDTANSKPFILNGELDQTKDFRGDKKFIFAINHLDYNGLGEECLARIAERSKLVGIGALIKDTIYPIRDPSVVEDFLLDPRLGDLRKLTLLRQFIPTSAQFGAHKSTLDYLKSEVFDDYYIKAKVNKFIKISDLLSADGQKTPDGFTHAVLALKKHLVSNFFIPSAAAETAAAFIVRYSNKNALGSIDQDLLNGGLEINKLGDPVYAFGQFSVLMQKQQVFVVYNYEAAYQDYLPTGKSKHSALDFKIKYRIPFEIIANEQHKSDLNKLQLHIYTPSSLFSSLTISSPANQEYKDFQPVSADQLDVKLLLEDYIKQSVFNLQSINQGNKNQDQWF